jgi:uncharacterized LabA/DUF88 family protein
LNLNIPPHRQRDRVAIFIDGSNLYHALEENCQRMDLNFEAFTQKLSQGRPLYRIYYYNIRQDEKRRPREHKEQERFLNALYKVPYLEARLGHTREHQGVTVEKGVDVMLATDLLNLAWMDMYDTAVLVSGDGDFTYAVQMTKNLGKYVEVACFDSNQSPELAQVADQLHFLDKDYFAELWTTPVATAAGTAEAKRRKRRPTRRRKGNGTPGMAPGGQGAVSDGGAPPSDY